MRTNHPEAFGFLIIPVDSDAWVRESKTGIKEVVALV